MRRILIPFEEKQLARIKQRRRASGERTRVGAIRRLIDRGIDGKDPLANVIGLLRKHRPALERYGVARAAVFGSVARGQARRDSDVDIFVEFDRERSPDLFRYMQMQEELGALVAKATGRRVDVIDIDSMRETTRERALQDAVYAY